MLDNNIQKKSGFCDTFSTCLLRWSAMFSGTLGENNAKSLVLCHHDKISNDMVIKSVGDTILRLSPRSAAWTWIRCIFPSLLPKWNIWTKMWLKLMHLATWSITFVVENMVSALIISHTFWNFNISLHTVRTTVLIISFQCVTKVRGQEIHFNCLDFSDPHSWQQDDLDGMQI